MNGSEIGIWQVAQRIAAALEAVTPLRREDVLIGPRGAPCEVRHQRFRLDFQIGQKPRTKGRRDGYLLIEQPCDVLIAHDYSEAEEASSWQLAGDDYGAAIAALLSRTELSGTVQDVYLGGQQRPVACSIWSHVQLEVQYLLWVPAGAPVPIP